MLLGNYRANAFLFPLSDELGYILFFRTNDRLENKLPFFQVIPVYHRPQVLTTFSFLSHKEFAPASKFCLNTRIRHLSKRVWQLTAVGRDGVTFFHLPPAKKLGCEGGVEEGEKFNLECWTGGFACVCVSVCVFVTLCI